MSGMKTEISALSLSEQESQNSEKFLQPLLASFGPYCRIGEMTRAQMMHRCRETVTGERIWLHLDFCGLRIREKTMKGEATHAYISMVNAITYLLRRGEPAIYKPSSQSIQRQDAVDQQNADAEQYDQQNPQDPFQNQRQHRISP